MLTFNFYLKRFLKRLLFAENEKAQKADISTLSSFHKTNMVETARIIFSLSKTII